MESRNEFEDSQVRPPPCQKPYVNVFKHFAVEQWRSSSREGSVTSVMDKLIGKKVYRIVGNVLASNNIRIPAKASQSLSLTGRYFYAEIRPIPQRFFSIHVFVVAKDETLVDIAITNLGTLASKANEGATCRSLGSTLQYPCQLDPKWTVLCVDLQEILEQEKALQLRHVRGIQICANLFVRGVMTSDLLYTPGFLPRDFALPTNQGRDFDAAYSWRHLPDRPAPSPGPIPPFPSSTSPERNSAGSQPAPMADLTNRRTSYTVAASTSKPADSANVAAVGRQAGCLKGAFHRALLPAAPEQCPATMSVGYAGQAFTAAECDSEGGTGEGGAICRKKAEGQQQEAKDVEGLGGRREEDRLGDAGLVLRWCIGYGGAAPHALWWSMDGRELIYPSGSTVIAASPDASRARFFIGHSAAVAAVALAPGNRLLASCQYGKEGVVRLWDLTTCECLAVLGAHGRDVQCISFDPSGNRMITVGKDDRCERMAR